MASHWHAAATEDSEDSGQQNIAGEFSHFLLKKVKVTFSVQYFHYHWHAAAPEDSGQQNIAVEVQNWQLEKRKRQQIRNYKKI